MNGGGIKNRSFFCGSLSLFATLIFSCGLDTYYVMDLHPVAENVREYTNDDPALNYFEFISAANPNQGNSEFQFLGTAVYYKIYSSAQTMISNHNSIESLNTSTNYSAAAERMINTYGYQELYTDVGSVTPLCPNEGVRVRIRLTNFQESVGSGIENKAQITVGGASYSPRRSRGQSYTFDFGRYEKNEFRDTGLKYDAPQSGDEDFSGSPPSDGKYYVELYAVAVGRDTTFATYYSNVAYLGSMTIDSNSEHN